MWHTASLLNSQSDTTAMNNIFRKDPSEFQEIISAYEDTNAYPGPGNIKNVLSRHPFPLKLANCGIQQ